MQPKEVEVVHLLVVVLHLQEEALDQLEQEEVQPILAALEGVPQHQHQVETVQLIIGNLQGKL